MTPHHSKKKCNIRDPAGRKFRDKHPSARVAKSRTIRVRVCVDDLTPFIVVREVRAICGGSLGGI